MKPVYRPRWPAIVVFVLVALAECFVIYLVCTGR